MNLRKDHYRTLNSKFKVERWKTPVLLGAAADSGAVVP